MNQHFDEWLAFDPETGIFRWKKTRGKATAGDIADALSTSGYITIGLKGRNYYAHRLAWFMTYGEWPAELIDHINGDRLDNRISNLRLADYHLNAQNVRQAMPASKTGVLGVWEIKGRFKSQISVGKKRFNVGSFATLEEAREAYLAAKRVLHPGCTI